MEPETLTVEELIHTDLVDLAAMDWVLEQFKDKQLISIIRCDELKETTFRVSYHKKPTVK
jgi:hypothetical protein